MAYPISDVPRRVVYSGSAGVGPYAFTFEVLANTDIAVYKNAVLLTLTTDYTVSINTGTGTGTVTLLVAATGSDQITIVGDRAIQRTSDFVTGGDLFANTLNAELDGLTIYSQQVDEKADRAIKAPVTDPTTINMTLPAQATRANKILGFSASGNPTQTSNTLAAIDAATTAINEIAAAPSGSSAGITFLQAGSGAVVRTAQSKMRDVVSVKDFGAVGDGVTNNTAAVQSALDSLGQYGGTVYINEGCKFNLKSLTLPALCNIDYRADDDTSSPGSVSDIASNERVLFSSNSSYPADPTGGIVNEWRMTAPFHPGAVVDVRKDVTSAATYLGPGQSMTNPVRASYNIMDEQAQRWSTLYQNYDAWSNFSGLYSSTYRTVITLNGIGTAQWTSVPAENALITGQTSGAKGFLLSVAAGATTVLWFSGKFVAGETLSDNNETTTATVTSVSASTTSMPWLGQDFKRGNFSIGLPPGVPRHLFAVGGKIAATKTRAAGQYVDATVTNPSYVWVDDYEAGATNGLEIVYDTTPAAASRRLFLRNLNSLTNRSQVGAVFAHGAFNDSGGISASAYNISSITKNGTGDYTVNFIDSAVAADYSITLSTRDGLQYAYVFVYTASLARIRVVTTGTNTLVDIAGELFIQCMGGDIT